MPPLAASIQRRFQLKRQQKLLNGEQFKTVFSGRCSVHGQFFSCHVVVNSLDIPRIGLAVSKKVSKKAVQRNRLKRQIRTSFRLNQDELSAVDFVVVSKTGCADQENKTLRAELDKLWHKANQKCEKFQQ